VGALSQLSATDAAYAILGVTIHYKRMGMKLFKDQRGIGHVIEIVVIAVILLGVGAFIWWRVAGSQQQSGTNNSSAQSALEQAIASASCTYEDKDLCKFMTGWKVGADIKVESTQTADGTATVSTFVSTQKGANSHLIMTIGDKPYETITIGLTRYTKSGDGTWWKEVIPQTKVEESTSTYDPSFDEPSTGDTAVDKTSYKKLGTEACGSLTCLKYQIIDPENPATQYLWFDTQNYQLRRMLMEDSTSKFDQTYTYENVSVSAPSSSKDLPAGYYLMPGADAPVKVPTAEDLMSE
jgi:hypothetical protein